ncbi:MAG: N-acetylmuramoyl-L-alanine amidase [Candidatus Competibacterales bacterium]|nr:N-acetylmuramoyl-L-alanine amidase [Candidatus Competibacterales bacterium]
MAPQVPTQRTQTRDAIVKTHSITPRNSWGTITPKYNKLVLDWNYDCVAVHHSGNWGYKDPKDIENLHMNKNGYDDVGYHYLIHPNGTIYEGREIVYKGSHVRLKNTGKIGILMMGDYDHQLLDWNDDTLSQKHLLKLKELIKTLKKHFPLKKLGGHKEYLPNSGYTCPGGELMKVMGQLRKDLSLNVP